MQFSPTQDLQIDQILWQSIIISNLKTTGDRQLSHNELILISTSHSLLSAMCSFSHHFHIHCKTFLSWNQSVLGNCSILLMFTVFNAPE